MFPAAACREEMVSGYRRNGIKPALGRETCLHSRAGNLRGGRWALNHPECLRSFGIQVNGHSLRRVTDRAPACSPCSKAAAARRTGSQVRLASTDPVYLALYRSGWGWAGVPKIALRGCKWVTHPHRSLLHIFMWGKAPLIGFVDKESAAKGGNGCGYGLQGGTVHWRVPFAGKARSRQAASPALAPQSPPAHRATLPAFARLRCFALIYRLRRHRGCQRWASCAHSGNPPCPRLLIALCIDAAGMRFEDVIRVWIIARSRSRRMEVGSSGTFSTPDLYST